MLAIGKIDEVDPRLLDHPGQFPGGQDIIDITVAAAGHLGTPGLIFLGGAGHNGYRDDILGIDPGLRGVIRLGQGTEHLLGRLTGGEVGEEVGIEMFAELDPARAA